MMLDIQQPAGIRRIKELQRNHAEMENMKFLLFSLGQLDEEELPIVEEMDDDDIHGSCHEAFALENRGNRELTDPISKHQWDHDAKKQMQQQPMSNNEIGQVTGYEPVGGDMQGQQQGEIPMEAGIPGEELPEEQMPQEEMPQEPPVPGMPPNAAPF
jgi:hypothetical protein